MLQIKAVNPNVKILGYKDFLGQQPTANDWTEVNKHEDYFAHDANGNRIRNSDWGWYLMDISSLGWRQYLVSYINAHTNNGAYDGVFADDVWTVFWDVYKFDQTVPTSIKTNLKTDMLGLLQYVKSNMLPGKVLFINTDDWTTQNYISASDGMMIEGYGHAAWESLDNPGSQGISNILQQINALSLNSGNGKIVWANSGSTISDFSDYVRINKMIKNRADGEMSVQEALQHAAIWDEVKDRLHKSALSMSGGEQQRLCIARALAVRPQILLMDEPASALDPISTSKIEELIFRLKKDYTIVIVTHNMQQAARVSDHTAFFLQGELVEFGPTVQIFTNPRDKRTEDYITGRFG